jgi:hypothetical protein
MNLELDDDERAALVELITAEVKATRYPLSPRLRPLRSILAKLGPEIMPAAIYPPPKSPGAPSLVLIKGKGRR